MQYPLGYTVPVRICITRESYHQYPWGYALPVSHIISTRESYPQYPWGYAVPVSDIISTREDMQYPWVISSVPMSHILSTREDMQYPWGYALPVREVSFILHSYKFTHGYCISSRVLRIWLTGTDDMTHRYCISSRVLRIWLTGTEDMTHGYCISSRVLRIWLTGTDDMTHGYCISSRVRRIWLTGTAYPHRYWGYDSRVLMIWLSGNAYPHGYWGYDSQVLMIWLTGNAYPHGYYIPSRVLHIVYTGWRQIEYSENKIVNYFETRLDLEYTSPALKMHEICLNFRKTSEWKFRIVIQKTSISFRDLNMPKLKFLPHCTEYPPQYWCYPPTVLMLSPACTDVMPPMYWIPSTVLKVSPTVLMLSPTVLNNLHSTEGIPPQYWSYSPACTSVIPQSTEGIPPQYWIPSTVLMLSPTVLMLSPRMYWCYPPTVLNHLHSTEAIPPQYWSYPPTVLKLSPHSTEAIPHCTEQPPQYWSFPPTVYVGWLLKDHFWLRDWVSPEPAVNHSSTEIKGSWIFLNDHFPGQNKAQRHIQDLQEKWHVRSFILWLKWSIAVSGIPKEVTVIDPSHDTAIKGLKRG